MNVQPAADAQQRPGGHGTAAPGDRPTGPRAPAAAAGRAKARLGAVEDAALLGILLVAPLCMGGRGPFGRFVFVALTAILTLAWFGRWCCDHTAPGVTTTKAFGWIAAGAALVLLQIVPLPASILAAVAPARAELLPLWTTAGPNGVAPMGPWATLSFTPAATRAGLVLFLAYGLLFFVVVQRIQRLEDVERMLRWIGISAIAMAVLGLLQYLASNDKFLWVYQHPFRGTSDSVKGTFINHNHFAHMLALGLGPIALSAILAVRRETDRRRTGSDAVFGRAAWGSGSGGAVAFCWLAGLGAVLFAGLLALSRGGAVAMAVALGVSLLVLLRAALINVRVLLAGAAALAVVVAALAIHGHQRVARRLDDLAAGSLARLDRTHSRRTVWVANLAAIADFPLFGTGVGSHAEVHPRYRPDNPPVQYTHAENGYLQVASETGIAGLVLLLSGMALVGWWSFRVLRGARSARLLGAAGVLVAGILASAVHALVDFVWYVPACMSLVVVLLACLVRLVHLIDGGQPDAPALGGNPVNDSSARNSRSSGRSRSRETSASTGHGPNSHDFGYQTPSRRCPSGRRAWLARPAVAAAVAGLAVWMVLTDLGPAVASYYWDQYLRLSVAAQKERQQLIETPPERAAVADRIGASPALAALSQAMPGPLTKVLAWYPNHAQAHMRLAGISLDRFEQLQMNSENAMELSQIAAAATASKFATRAALDRWLQRAVGRRRQLLETALAHTHRGLQLCPLQGQGYVYLAELCFLLGQGAPAKLAYLEQARRVRPHDPNILFASGKHAALAGDFAATIDFWKRSFHEDQLLQLQMARTLARRVPLPFFLDTFRPSCRDLRVLIRQYPSLPAADAATAGQYCLERARAEARGLEPRDTAAVWLTASRVCQHLGQTTAAARCARLALQGDANNEAVRRQAAITLLEAGDAAAAATSLRWCLRRNPNDRGLRGLYERSLQGRAGAQVSRTAGGPTRSSLGRTLH